MIKTFKPCNRWHTELWDLHSWNPMLISQVLFSITDVTRLFSQLNSLSHVCLHNIATVVPGAVPCALIDQDPTVLGSLQKQFQTDWGVISIFLLNKCLVDCGCIGKQILGEVLREWIELLWDIYCECLRGKHEQQYFLFKKFKMSFVITVDLRVNSQEESAGEISRDVFLKWRQDAGAQNGEANEEIKKEVMCNSSFSTRSQRPGTICSALQNLRESIGNDICFTQLPNICSWQSDYFSHSQQLQPLSFLNARKPSENKLREETRQDHKDPGEKKGNTQI